MYLIGGGKLVTMNSSDPFYENGAVVTDGESIIAVGRFDLLKKRFTEAEFIDADGGVIMPGLINAHAHLSASLLRGFPASSARRSTLYESLCEKSWKYDSSLGYFDVSGSAYAGVVECIRSGVTSVFDLCASYGSISGSLLAIAGVVEEAGIRGCLAYETSHRHGYEKCSEAIEENDFFIRYCTEYGLSRIKPMFGLHSPFTLTDLDVEECVRRNGGRTGFHVHVSEGLDDRYSCLHNYGKQPVEWLHELGAVREGSILVHCVNVTPEEMDLIASSGAFAVSCPASNMLNGVGAAPVPEMLERGITVGLGTDSVGYDILESARAFVLAQNNSDRSNNIGAAEAAKLLFDGNRRIAERYFGKGIGVLREGAPADVIVMDYRPFTVFDENTALLHIIEGMRGSDCTTMMVSGKLVMKNRELLTLDVKKISEKIRIQSAELRKRLEETKDGGLLPPINAAAE